MIVAEVRHWLVRAPFRAPISWGSGARSGTTRLIVELRTDQDVVGYGETICLLDATEAVFRNVVSPIVRGYDVADVEKLHRHVLGAGYYHHKRAAVAAIAAAEMAMWDALGKAAGLPLHRLWGGLWRREVAVAAYVFAGDDAALERDVGAFLDAGYETFKLKIGLDQAADLRMVETVRGLIGPDRPLRADVNGAWTTGTAKRQLARLAPFDLQYVEQPLELDDLAGAAELRRWSPVPIALDESAYTLADVANIVRAGAADVVLLDPHQTGGLWQTIKAAAICEAVGLPVTLHSGGELAPSQAAYLHLAVSVPNMSLAIDCERALLADDVSPAPPAIRDGAMRVPEGPGLGIEVDLGAVERLAVPAIEGAYLDPARPGWFPVKPMY